MPRNAVHGACEEHQKKAHKRFNYAPLRHGLINPYGINAPGLCGCHRQLSGIREIKYRAGQRSILLVPQILFQRYLQAG